MRKLKDVLRNSAAIEPFEEYCKIILDINRNKFAFCPLNMFSASFTYNNKQRYRLHRLSDAGILEETRDSSYTVYKLTSVGKAIAESLVDERKQS